MEQISVETQFGCLCVTATNGAISQLGWGGGATSSDPLLHEAAAQITAYDGGRLTQFDLPLHVAGTDFQRAVCAQMSAIAFGDTVTYGDIAREIGASARAVGRACGANPIAIIIPCHRVMGAAGLTGFSGAGGVETKVALLRHEGAGGLLI
jgi:methylated-DNA-[protein]-cysteine S-methyltransferase